jgi:hypothetical protein
MFGWLATRSALLCRHAPRPLIAQRSRRIAPESLLSALPGLGCVLYLHTTSAAQAPHDVPLPGWLVAERALAPLLETRWLLGTGMVTDDGPREWLECMDGLGRIRARLHLLPDTDYLAWDALMNADETHHGTSAPSHLMPLRPDSAVVTSFGVRELGGLRLLRQSRPAALSSLGGRIAARIAHAESAALLS